MKLCADRSALFLVCEVYSCAGEVGEGMADSVALEGRDEKLIGVKRVLGVVGPLKDTWKGGFLGPNHSDLTCLTCPLFVIFLYMYLVMQR